MALGALTHQFRLDNGPLADTETTTDTVAGVTLTASTDGTIDREESAGEYLAAAPGLLFNATDNEILSVIPCPTAFLPVAGSTYEAVFDLTALGAVNTVFAGSAGGGNDRIVLRVNALGQLLVLCDVTNLYSANTTAAVVSAGQTHHVLIVVPDPIGTVLLYVDGVVVATSGSSNIFPDNSLSVGAYLDTATPTAELTGAVHLIRRYSGAATADDATALAKAAKLNPDAIPVKTGLLSGIIGKPLRGRM